MRLDLAVLGRKKERERESFITFVILLLDHVILALEHRPVDDDRASGRPEQCRVGGFD